MSTRGTGVAYGNRVSYATALGVESMAESRFGHACGRRGALARHTLISNLTKPSSGGIADCAVIGRRLGDQHQF